MFSSYKIIPEQYILIEFSGTFRDIPEKMEVRWKKSISDRISSLIRTGICKHLRVRYKWAERIRRKTSEERGEVSHSVEPGRSGLFSYRYRFDKNDCPVGLFYGESNAAAAHMLGRDYAGKRLR